MTVRLAPIRSTDLQAGDVLIDANGLEARYAAWLDSQRAAWAYEPHCFASKPSPILRARWEGMAGIYNAAWSRTGTGRIAVVLAIQRTWTEY